VSAQPAGIRFETATDALVQAFPELRICRERAVAGWGGESPGQYIDFSELLGTLGQILMAMVEVAGMPKDVPGRERLLERFFDFAEQLLASDDREARYLGMDMLEGVITPYWAGYEAVEEFAGQEVKRWWASAREDFHLPDGEYEEILDTEGVRAAIAPLLPTVPLNDIPGISHPADYLSLGSLEEVQQKPDGAVLLAAYGTNHPFVVARAASVDATHDVLDEAAQDVAEHLGGDAPQGAPGAVYRLIPHGERVWQMDVGDDAATRLYDDPWVRDELQPWNTSILDLLAGRSRTLRW
jgi:hypothetical protein